MHYLHGPSVDPAYSLADGREFSGIDQFKQLLLADKDKVARSLTVKLVTYATGGPPEEIDEPEIDAILSRVSANDGLRTLVQEIVQSRLFLEK
jgi:hypothetical protein